MTKDPKTISGEKSPKPGHGSPLDNAAAGGDLADRLRPWLLAAATALWVARPLFPSEAAATCGDGLPVVMLWLLLAGCWLAATVASRRFFLRFGWTDAAAGLLIGLVALAALWAVRHGSPRPAVNMLWEWTGLGLGFFLTRQLLGGPRQTRAMVAAMIALAVALSGYGLYQRRSRCRGPRPSTRPIPMATCGRPACGLPPVRPSGNTSRTA